jgi:SAM-dependent methyltransferase
MSIQLAKAILDRIGPARVVHAGAGEGDTLVAELRLQGCYAVRAEDAAPGEAIDAVVLDLAHASPIAPLLRTLSAYKGAGVLILRAEHINRWEAEQLLVSAGWRRHPAGLLSHEYEALHDNALAATSFYQRVPAPAAARWSTEDLEAERPLRMDRLRESGARADAHIARYALAAEFVRPGDRVLDCACGLGYGSAVLAALSRGASFLGVDLEPAAIEYAQANYGGPDLRFAVGDAAALEGVADSSIDLIVCLDTLERLPDWEAALAAFQRVLKPDGRLICSAPDRWAGEAADPANLHLFDWARLSGALGQSFILEAKYIQTAPGGSRLPSSPRILRRWPMDDNQEAEWVLAVVSANPFAATREQVQAYSHPAFSGPQGTRPPRVADFRAHYDNPYLYRMMVQMGERLRADDILFQLALMTSNNARPDSPDRGGAIAVLGYMVLEGRSLDDVGNVMGLIEDYAQAAAGSADPHTARWRLSHAFLAAKLMELCNDQAAAIAWYRRTAQQDWRAFSPLLATKTVAAAFFEGRLHLLANDEAQARACFEHGVREALAAARAPASDIVGDPAHPLPFGLQELAEVVDMGSQCATALANLPLWRRSPGLFLRQIDTRRFGLAGWARDLERENRRLTGAPF